MLTQHICRKLTSIVLQIHAEYLTGCNTILHITLNLEAFKPHGNKMHRLNLMIRSSTSFPVDGLQKMLGKNLVIIVNIIIDRLI